MLSCDVDVNADVASDINNDGKHDTNADSDDDDEDNWTEKFDGKPDNIGNDTLILNENADIENIMTALKSFAIAPGEGQTPLPVTLDKYGLRAAYPTLFAGEMPEKQHFSLSISDIAKLYIEHSDPRFRLHSDFYFALYRVLQTYRLKNSVFVNLRKNKRLDGKNVTARDVLETSTNDLIQYNDGYKVLKCDRSSPAYWEKVKKELFVFELFVFSLSLARRFR